MAPRRLTDLVIREVSSVDKGAGRGVKILLMKRDDDRSRHSPQRDPVTALSESVASILDDDSLVGKSEALIETFGQFMDYLADSGVTKKETDMALPKDEAELKKAIDDAVAAAIKKSAEEGAVALAKLQGENAILKMTDAHKSFMKDSGMSEDKCKAFTAMTDEQRTDYMSKNPLKKNADPEIAKRDAEIADLNKKMVELTKDNAARAEREEIDTFKKRAVASGLKEEHGEIMRKAYKGDAAAQVEVEKLFATVTKALAEAQKTGKIFSEFGTTVAKGGATAYDMIVSKAAELRKTDAGKNLTEAQAFSKVYTDPANAELVEQSKQETAKAAA